MKKNTVLLLSTILAVNAMAAPHRLVYFDGHMHTVHSDGSGSIADVRAAAMERGLDAVFITNHTGGVSKEVSSGRTHWDLIVQECQALSGPDFLMIPSFEITGNESNACRDHVLAWGVKDPYVGDNAARIIPESRWPSPGNSAGTGPLNPESIAAWADYIRKNNGIAVHAHPTGTTQPGYGVDFLELWNCSHIKDVVRGCLDMGLSEQEAWAIGVHFNDVTTQGEDWLFKNISVGGDPVQARLAFFQNTGVWLGKSRDNGPSGTQVNTWDELLMMYVNGDIPRPIFGVAASDAHNTVNIDFARTDPTYDDSDVGEARNGVMLTGEFTEANLVAAIKRGNLFATTGPSIEFDVGGKIMGETVQVTRPSDGANPRLNITLGVSAEKPGLLLETVKVIKSGVTILDASPMKPRFQSRSQNSVSGDCYYRVEVTAVDPALAALGRYPYFHAWSNPIFVDL